jgi:hypothetical protein
MKKEKCTICKKGINGFGNNAEPIKKGTCCCLCNDLFVIPARLQQLLSPMHNERLSKLLK